MALNFPASPIDGQIYTDTATGNQYKYVTAYGYWTNFSPRGGYFQGNNGEIAPQNYGDIFRSHSNTLTSNVTVYSGNNSVAVGPLTIAVDNKLTIEPGARVSIV